VARDSVLATNLRIGHRIRPSRAKLGAVGSGIPIQCSFGGNALIRVISRESASRDERGGITPIGCHFLAVCGDVVLPAGCGPSEDHRCVTVVP
jgi:hypothetical protein